MTENELYSTSQYNLQTLSLVCYKTTGLHFQLVANTHILLRPLINSKNITYTAHTVRETIIFLEFHLATLSVIKSSILSMADG
jgi:hypothetical protein